VADASPEVSRRATFHWRVLLGLYAGALSAGTHWPRLQLGDPERPPDKALHFVAFAVLTPLLWQARIVRSPWALLALGIAWCAVDELTQGLPGVGRVVSFADFVASSFGVLVATAFVAATRPCGGPLARRRRARFDFALDALLARPGPWIAVASAAALGVLVVMPLAVLVDARFEARGAGVGPFAASLFGAGLGVAIAAPAALLAGLRHEDRRLVAAGVYDAPLPTLSSAALVGAAWGPALAAILAFAALFGAIAAFLSLRMYLPAAARLHEWSQSWPKGMDTAIDATLVGLVVAAAVFRTRRNLAVRIDAGDRRCIACDHAFGPGGATRCPECGAATVP